MIQRQKAQFVGNSKTPQMTENYRANCLYDSFLNREKEKTFF